MSKKDGNDYPTDLEKAVMDSNDVTVTPAEKSEILQSGWLQKVSTYGVEARGAL